MALIDFKVLPGIDKQDTTAGAENRWGGISAGSAPSWTRWLAKDRSREGLVTGVGSWALALVLDRTG